MAFRWDFLNNYKATFQNGRGENTFRVQIESCEGSLFYALFIRMLKAHKVIGIETPIPIGVLITSGLSYRSAVIVSYFKCDSGVTHWLE